MNNFIDINSRLKEHTEYNNTISEAREAMQELYDYFFDKALHLALQNKWKAWEKTVPVGECLVFDEEMLLNTGDPNVAMLTHICQGLRQTCEALKELK